MTRQLPCPGSSPSAASMHVDTSAALEVLVLTCRDGDCLAQWTPTPIERDGRLVVALSVETCPACGSSTWEVTEAQVASSPSARTRRRGRGTGHPSSSSGRGF